MTPDSQHEHSHPGGTGAVLGTRLARYSGFQGLSLLITNVLHFASIAVVARFLGPSPLGSFALLFFFTGLITQVIHLLSKPGTIMRTFGISDDDDDDVEGEEEEKDPVSDRPTYTLGVGIVWCSFLAITAVAIVYAVREPIAGWLLGDRGQAAAVVYATITGAVWAIFKLGEIVYWFEGRPLAYALVDASRPAFNLIAIVAILAGGGGVEGAVVGQMIGTSVATVLCIALLRRSYQLGFSFGEVVEILKRGSMRIPIASSMWVIQNADAFLLSRFLSHKDVGLYQLASRTGFMVAFLPQGFRMALRPLRKAAVYRAYRKEYGVSVAHGQLLAYFVLLALTAILAMVLAGEILIQIGGSRFKSAAPIIPLTAAAMTMPALYRTVSSMSQYPNKRRTFILSTVLAAPLYVGLVLVLVPNGLGIYGAPVAMLIAFAIPVVYMFLRSQLGSDPIEFPYLAMLQATVVAAGIAIGWHLLHPDNKWLELGLIAVLMGIWVASLFLFRIIPRYHWKPIAHIARSVLRGSALRFDPVAGLGALDPADRQALQVAINDRLPAQALGVEADGASEGARLVQMLRRAGESGGVPISASSDLDSGISLFLFSDQPVAVRLAKMRELLAGGADAHELRTLEDLRDDLARASSAAWD